jgi:hypothetical protein
MSGQTTPRYRKRRPLPAIVSLIFLLAVAVVVWVVVAQSSHQATGPRDCPLPSDPATAATLGKALPPDALNAVEPLPPAQVQARVLNASPNRGEAGAATRALRQHGFTGLGRPANDSIYDPVASTNYLQCRGQIRFGRTGARAARTLSLVEPCMQLVKDDRTTASVELVLGTGFDTVRLSSSAQRALHQISLVSERRGGHSRDGRTTTGAAPARVSQQILAKAHDVTC